MTQAVGAQAYLAFCEETTWGVVPGSPAMKKLKAATYGETLKASIGEVMSNSINGSRAVDYTRAGDIDVKGGIPFELPLLGIATILKHALGGKTTTGAGPYTHVLKRGALPVGLTIEKAFVDIGQYFRYSGCKIDGMSLSIDTGGIVKGSIDVVGQSVTEAVAALGTPTSVSHVPFMHYDATFQEGGSAVTLLGMNLKITNELTPVRTIGNRNIASLPEGKGEVTGDITLMFQDRVQYDKWKAGTQSSLKATFTSASGSIEFYMPAVFFNGDAAPAIQNANGIVLPLNFRAILDGGTNTDLQVTIINTEPTI